MSSKKIETRPRAAGKQQIDKFREAARELETDDREEAFDAMVKKIAKPAPAQKHPSETRD